MRMGNISRSSYFVTVVSAMLGGACVSAVPPAGSSGTPSRSSASGTVDDAGTIVGGTLIAQLLNLTKTCAGSAIIPNSHAYLLDNGTATSICALTGAIYFTADMDIDCDGIMTTHCPGTGADKDCCWQNQTSFHGPNSAYDTENPPLKSLASENTPYVVIPGDVVYPGLDQRNGGNIVAVIYNNQLEFAVFGDQGPNNVIGEASVRTANGLGIPASPASGGIGGGVTYIAFVGTGSQPSDMENLTEIQTLGAKLVQRLIANNP